MEEAVKSIAAKYSAAIYNENSFTPLRRFIGVESMAVTKLILARHGESQWNKENRSLAGMMLDLFGKGVSEAKAAGKLKRRRFRALILPHFQMKRLHHTP